MYPAVLITASMSLADVSDNYQTQQEILYARMQYCMHACVNFHLLAFESLQKQTVRNFLALYKITALCF